MGSFSRREHFIVNSEQESENFEEFIGLRSIPGALRLQFLYDEIRSQDLTSSQWIHKSDSTSY